MVVAAASVAVPSSSAVVPVPSRTPSMSEATRPWYMYLWLALSRSKYRLVTPFALAASARAFPTSNAAALFEPPSSRLRDDAEARVVPSRSLITCA